MASSKARAFWMAREQQMLQQDTKHAHSNGFDGLYYATLGRVNGFDSRAGSEDGAAATWAGVYCTLRDKRRSRSRTPTSSIQRSVTPSSISSGRTTPSPGPQFRMTSRTMSEEVLSTCSEPAKRTCIPHSPRRFQTTCWLEPRPVPVHYSSTVYMKIGSTKKRYVEEVCFQTRLVPRRYSERMVTATTIPSRRFTSVLEIQCLPPPIHIISLNEPTSNGATSEQDI